MNTCEQAGLVEAMFDGRLGVGEQTSTERHVRGCDECRELLSELSCLRAQLQSSTSRVTPLEHQRARLALLRKGARPLVTRRRPWPLFAAALTALPAVVWAAAAPSSPLRIWLESIHWEHVEDERSGAKGHTTAPQPAGPMPSVTGSVDNTPSLRGSGENREQKPVVAPSDTGVELATSASSDQVHRPAPAQLSRRSASGGSEQTSASRAFALALQTLARGDFGAAAQSLGQFVSNYPTDLRVEDAVYLQAIALQRAGRNGDAKAAAERYLVAYPQGVHQTQARRISGQ